LSRGTSSRLEALDADVEAALESVNVPSYVLDATGIIRWLNPAAERLVGDCRGRHFTSLVAPEDRRRAQEVFAQKVVGNKVATDTSGAILADPRRLRQIARGLISNAVKFTPEGGKIRVELSTLRGEMELRVRNSGPGLDPEFIPRLFAPFTRASEASTTAGLGIGLALVRHFVERHGGTIDVVSVDAERGTTFMVRIPARA